MNNNEDRKMIIDVLKKVESQFENSDIDPKDVIIIAFKKVISECKEIGITNTDLKKAGLWGKTYQEAIVSLKDRNKLTEVLYGRTNVLYLTEVIEGAIGMYQNN